MNILEVRGLRKEFGGLVAVEDLDMAVQSGEIVGLIGPNGAGKTTLFNLISGFFRPNAGEITFQRQSIIGLKPHQICLKGITRTFQIAQPFQSLTVLENVMVGAFSQNQKFSVTREMALDILHQVELFDSRSQEASAITIASQKRLELAKALATKPRLLLLDEVMSGLTFTEISEVLSMIKKIGDSGITILLIEHVMHAVMSLCDRIIVLHHGRKVAEGNPQQVAREKIVIDAYLGEGYTEA